MRRINWVGRGIACLWAFTVVFWPRQGDPSGHDDSERQGSGERLYQSGSTRAGLGLTGARFYQSNDGKKRWSIESKFAELYQTENTAFMEHVTARFFSERTGNVITTKSRYGRSLVDREQVELTGGVSIRPPQGYLFTTEQILYDGKAGSLHSDAAVQMKGPREDYPTMTLRGVGLDANIETEHFRLKRQVWAQKQIKGRGEKLRITSRSGEFFTMENRAVFVNRARATLPDVTIEGDLMEIGLQNSSESLRATGNVRVKSRDRVGTSQGAIFELSGRRIVLDGEADVVDASGNRLEGRRIVIFTDSERVEVDTARGGGLQ